MESFPIVALADVNDGGTLYMGIWARVCPCRHQPEQEREQPIKENILKNVGNRAVLGHHWLPYNIFFSTMDVNGAPKHPGYKLSSKYLPLCSAEQIHSYRFGTTWGWVNYDSIFIFGWTIRLSLRLYFQGFGLVMDSFPSRRRDA